MKKYSKRMLQLLVLLLLIELKRYAIALPDDTPMLDGQPMAVTPFGTYLGYKMQTSRQKRPIYAFTGIPYALPPVGDLRFRHPIKKGSFKDIFNATSDPPECLQWDHLLGRGTVGSEDCLYLNVYTNRVPPPPHYYNTQPTLVFLHAGTWLAGAGASDLFLPDYFSEHDIFVVTINHRLGPLGFLSTESSEAPGNFGLMDQVLALEWVRDNVRYFGGFNETVTVMGSGAGGTSAHLLTLTPKTRGASVYLDDSCLVGRAISHSGTAYSPHTITRNAKSQAVALGIKLGCPIDDVSLMINCLRLKDAKDIVDQIPTLFEFDEEPIPFTPVIDTWAGTDAVIPDEPFHLIKKRQFLQVPWISGTNENDGAFRVQDLLKDPSHLSLLNKKWDKYGPILLHLKDSCKDPVDVANTIRDHYMGKGKFNEANAQKFVDMMTDRFFLVPTAQAMDDHCYYSKEHCYRYMFHYSGRASFLDILHAETKQEKMAKAFGNPRFQNTRDIHGWGVSFLDELLYLFPSNKTNHNYEQSLSGDTVSAISHQLQIFYANFIKGGDPSPHTEGFEDVSIWGSWWEPYYPGSNFYLYVDPEMETKDDIYREEHIKFWKSLPLYENRDHNIIRDEL